MAKKILKSALFFILAAAPIFLLIYARRKGSSTLYLVSDADLKKKRCLVVVVHGWIDKGKDSWSQDTACEIAKKVDSQLWTCAFFDWSSGAATINPADAARFAREKAGLQLASVILINFSELKHIHLIGHSSGCLVINEAAKILAKNTSADLHLTFLDAYSPLLADADFLGDVPVKNGQKLFVENYFTRDYTGASTELCLKHAHNVDITELDQVVKDHKFPWRWYYATITGKYPLSIFSDGQQYSCFIDGFEYGFARSKESGEQQWNESLQLEVGNEPLICSRSGGD